MAAIGGKFRRQRVDLLRSAPVVATRTVDVGRLYFGQIENGFLATVGANEKFVEFVSLNVRIPPQQSAQKGSRTLLQAFSWLVLIEWNGDVYDHQRGISLFQGRNAVAVLTKNLLHIGRRIEVDITVLVQSDPMLCAITFLQDGVERIILRVWIPVHADMGLNESRARDGLGVCAAYQVERKPRIRSLQITNALKNVVSHGLVSEEDSLTSQTANLLIS